MKPVKIVTDRGWIFEDLVTEQGMAFGAFTDMIDIRKQEMFLKVVLRIQSIQANYERKYKKIQDVLAEIGGLLQSLLMFLAIIIVPLTKLDFYKSLIN